MPVYGRVGLASIVMEQRLRLVYDLAGLGVDAEMVVVGDDANLDTAREYGFHVVEAPNPLGRRINDGFEFAFRELGADHVMFNGSDSWLLPGPLADLPAPGRVRSSRRLAIASGRWLVQADAKPSCPWGRAPWTLGRELLEPGGFRPVPDERPRGLDGAIARAAGAVFDVADEDDPLRVVDFRLGPWTEQLTPWHALVKSERRRDRLNPWEALATRYPADLVARMERFYAEGTGS